MLLTTASYYCFFMTWKIRYYRNSQFLFFAVLLLRRIRRKCNRNLRRNVEAFVVVDALWQDLWKAQKERHANLWPTIWCGNRSQKRWSEETQGERLKEDHQWLGRRLPGLHRKGWFHRQDRRIETSTHGTIIFLDHV